MQIKHVILDRDGVINKDSDQYIKKPDEFIIIDNTIEALYKLFDNNIEIFIATNQSGINRGLYTLLDFVEINNKLLKNIRQYRDNNNQHIITGVYYCPHIPDQNCECRKPKTGMIDSIVRNHLIDLNKTAFIGDSYRDLEAADEAGCAYLYLVKTGKGEATLAKHKGTSNTLIKEENIFNDLFHCVQHIITNNN